MNEITSSKVTKTSYMGKKATLTTHHMDGRSSGLRIVALQFDGDANVKLRMVKGDGRKAGFQELRVIESLPQSDVAKTVKEWANA